MMIGAGLGLTMLTLLIAVQHSVERTKLGVATSLNQFSRAIGGALGVAIMGSRIDGRTRKPSAGGGPDSGGALTADQAEAFASNPNALIDPSGKAELPGETLDILQAALAAAIHPVFWVGAIMAALGFVVVLFLPRPGSGNRSGRRADDHG